MSNSATTPNKRATRASIPKILLVVRCRQSRDNSRPLRPRWLERRLPRYKIPSVKENTEYV